MKQYLEWLLPVLQRYRVRSRDMLPKRGWKAGRWTLHHPHMLHHRAIGGGRGIPTQTVQRLHAGCKLFHFCNELVQGRLFTRSHTTNSPGYSMKSVTDKGNWKFSTPHSTNPFHLSRASGQWSCELERPTSL